MKVFLDDERPTPPGWIRVYWPEEAINLLQTGEVRCLSLDHDLGDTQIPERTGYDVLLWIEQEVVSGRLNRIPRIIIHSANSAAHLRMAAALASIKIRLGELPNFS